MRLHTGFAGKFLAAIGTGKGGCLGRRSCGVRRRPRSTGRFRRAVRVNGLTGTADARMLLLQLSARRPEPAASRRARRRGATTALSLVPTSIVVSPVSHDARFPKEQNFVNERCLPQTDAATSPPKRRTPAVGCRGSSRLVKLQLTRRGDQLPACGTASRGDGAAGASASASSSRGAREPAPARGVPGARPGA